MAAPIVPVFSRHARALDFFQGLLLPFAALRLIGRSRKLLNLSLVAAAVTLGSIAALVWGLLRESAPLLGELWPYPDSWPAAALWYAVLALMFLVLLVVGANTVPLLVLAPLQDPLSEATESLCDGETPPRASRRRVFQGFVKSMAHTLKRVLLLLLGHAALFVLHLLPGAGSVVWSVAATLWTMVWLAAEYLDVPMARHLYRFVDVRRVLRERAALCVGFGAAVYGLLWIPVLNFFFMPLAIVAGTLFFRGLRACGALPPSPR